MILWKKIVKKHKEWQEKAKNRESFGIDLFQENINKFIKQKSSDFFEYTKNIVKMKKFSLYIITIPLTIVVAILILWLSPKNNTKQQEIQNTYQTKNGEEIEWDDASQKFQDETLLKAEKVAKETAEKVIEKNTVDENCNSIVVKLQGPLVPHIGPNSSIFSSDEEQTSSEDICYKIETINEDEKIEAIIVEVDSPGGIPLAAEEIEKCIKRSYKPVLAYIRSSGTSAAYWSITSADRIFASSLSDVGSIGVYISYLDNVKKNKMEGLEYHLYSTGKFKDMFSSDKPTTKEEEKLIMDQLQSAHNIFVTTVSENRKIETETVKKISDGRVFDGDQAALIGLIDQIGGLFEVKKYIEENYLDNSRIEVCELSS